MDRKSKPLRYFVVFLGEVVIIAFCGHVKPTIIPINNSCAQMTGYRKSTFGCVARVLACFKLGGTQTGKTMSLALFKHYRVPPQPVPVVKCSASLSYIPGFIFH